MKITVDVIGAEAIRKDIMEIAKAPSTKKVWKAVAQEMKSESLRCFREQRAPDGTPWQKLSEGTLKSRAYRRTRGYRKKLKKIYGYQSKAFMRTKSGAKILMDTGKLRASIATKHSNDSAMVGSVLSYAKVHQTGGEHIPARPYLGVSDSGMDRIRGIILRHVKEAAWK